MGYDDGIRMTLVNLGESGIRFIGFGTASYLSPFWGHSPQEFKTKGLYPSRTL